MILNEKGSKKSVEELYSAIFAIREALQDATQLAAEAAVIAEAFGGEISRVITSQLNQYFIPAISKYIDDEKTPGAMSPLVTFLDSVPLAMTRQEPQPAQTTPAPIQAELAAPPTAAPAEGSYAAKTTESRKKEAYMTAAQEREKYGMTSSEMMTDMNSGQGAMKGHFTRADARKALEDDYQLQQKDAQKQVELDGDYELEDLTEAKRARESLESADPEQWFVVANQRGKDMPFRIRGGEAFRIAPWGSEDEGMTTVVVDPDDEIEVSLAELEAAYAAGAFAPEGGSLNESYFSALDAKLSGADQPDDDFEDEFSDEELTDDEDDLLFTDSSNMNESASETYGVFRIAGELKDDRVFTGTKVEADAFAADRNSKLDKTELDDQGIKYEVRKCTKPEGQKDVSKPGELPKVKENASSAKDFKVGDRFTYKDPVMLGKVTATVVRVDADQDMLVAETDRGYLFTVKSHEGERGYVPGAASMLRSQVLFSDIFPKKSVKEASIAGDSSFEIVEGPVVEQDRVTVDPAYGGGTGIVTDVRGSYITVKLDDGDVEIYHLSDLTKISESAKTDRWNREAADAQSAEAKMLSKEAELTKAARRIEELLDTGMGSIEAWDTVLEEFPGIDEDALASKL
jgi:hypothetical protein